MDWDIDKITGNNICANLKKYSNTSMACLSSIESNLAHSQKHHNSRHDYILEINPDLCFMIPSLCLSYPINRWNALLYTEHLDTQLLIERNKCIVTLSITTHRQSEETKTSEHQHPISNQRLSNCFLNHISIPKLTQHVTVHVRICFITKESSFQAATPRICLRSCLPAMAKAGNIGPTMNS